MSVEYVSVHVPCERNLVNFVNKLLLKLLQLHSWIATTWQGGHVGGQYNTLHSKIIIYIKKELTSQWRVILFSWPSTWPPWHHRQTSNACSHCSPQLALAYWVQCSALLNCIIHVQCTCNKQLFHECALDMRWQIANEVCWLRVGTLFLCNSIEPLSNNINNTISTL